MRQEGEDLIAKIGERGCDNYVIHVWLTSLINNDDPNDQRAR